MASIPNGLPRQGDLISAKYRVEETLGSGGMGAVFKVAHVVTGKHFAVKWLLPEVSSGADAIARFIREAQVAGRVDHPNVVDVYDLGHEADSFYMVMELLAGETLAQYICNRKQLSAEEASRILLPVGRGLQAAHAAGVIHRDLKPENIFLCRKPSGECEPKVLDFGISKLVARPAAANLALTAEGAMVGTPNYMAPEQVRSEPVDARTDVYALGVILYQLLTGALPFPAQSFNELVLKITSSTPVALGQLAPHTPAALVGIVDRAMARDPGERFDSIAEFARALEPFAGGMQFERMSAPPPAESLMVHPALASSARVIALGAPISRWVVVSLTGLLAVALAIAAVRFPAWRAARISTLAAESRSMNAATEAPVPSRPVEAAAESRQSAPALDPARSPAASPARPQPMAANSIATAEAELPAALSGGTERKSSSPPIGLRNAAASSQSSSPPAAPSGESPPLSSGVLPAGLSGASTRSRLPAAVSGAAAPKSSPPSAAVSGATALTSPLQLPAASSGEPAAPNSPRPAAAARRLPTRLPPARQQLAADPDPTGAIKLPAGTPPSPPIVRRAPQLSSSDFR